MSRSDYEALERELAGAMCDGLSMEGRYHEAVAECESLRAALREAGQYEPDTVEVTVRRDDGSVQFYEVRRARKSTEAEEQG